MNGVHVWGDERDPKWEMENGKFTNGKWKMKLRRNG
jgi:hypothetical protein